MSFFDEGIRKIC